METTIEISILSYGELTDTFIAENIPEDLYQKTKAHLLYGDKQTFCGKITDTYGRYLMLRDCLKLSGNNLYNKIVHLID